MDLLLAMYVLPFVFCTILVLLALIVGFPLRMPERAGALVVFAIGFLVAHVAGITVADASWRLLGDSGERGASVFGSWMTIILLTVWGLMLLSGRTRSWLVAIVSRGGGRHGPLSDVPVWNSGVNRALVAAGGYFVLMAVTAFITLNPW